MAITSDASEDDDDDQDDVDNRSTASSDSNEHNSDSLDATIANDSHEPIVQGDLLSLQDHDNAEEPILWVLRNGVYVEADTDEAAEVLADLDDDNEDDDENPNDADTYEEGSV
ncbi:transcriptional regulator IFH1 [Cephus cinctus]|uniref:Transcriptional regulator IFH1 n=1 Tax=Cephus cinctus TaxID=211228 RepID=A0AAJ7FEY8_CEPCN|nr:transcriptional regulator IFH1 [Cephus cinctus]